MFTSRVFLPHHRLLAGAMALALAGCGALEVPPAPVAPAARPAGGAQADAAEPKKPAPASPAASPTPAAAGMAVKFEALKYRAKPGAEVPRLGNQRIRSAEALATFLDAVGAEAAERPAPDFKAREVLALYDAGGSSGCDDARVEAITDDGKALSVRHARPATGPDVVCAMVVVEPHYDLVAIPRTDHALAGAAEWKGAAGAPGTSGTSPQAGLADALRARGLTVAAGDKVTQPFLPVEGAILKLSGGDLKAAAELQVFTFANAAAAEAASKDFGTRGAPPTVMVSWMGPPRWHRKDRLLVLYVGAETPVHAHLKAVLGAHVAGT